MIPNQTAPRVAVIGSINMDLLVRCPRLPRPGETLFGDEVLEVPGGKGANQAVAAARLGARVQMIGRVGSDAFADTLLQNLKAVNVDTTHVPRTENIASGLAFVFVETSGENQITVVPGSNGKVTPDDVAAAESVIASADILLLQLETPIETVLSAIELAHRVGTRVILDPAPAPAAVAEGLLHVDLICPNQSEATALTGRPAETIDEAIDAAKAMIALGAKNAVITLGRDGAALCDSSGNCCVIPAPEVTAVDTTAAGDAFAGALGLCWHGDTSLEEAVRFACAAGAVAASRLGAQPGMPSLDDVNQLLGE